MQGHRRRLRRLIPTGTNKGKIMADPMKIRAQMKGDVAEIRILMSHAMETGQRKDAAGNTVPAHFIQSMTIDVGGKRVVDGQTGTSRSRATRCSASR
jgi:hypothetical protein